MFRKLENEIGRFGQPIADGGVSDKERGKKQRTAMRKKSDKIQGKD